MPIMSVRGTLRPAGQAGFSPLLMDLAPNHCSLKAVALSSSFMCLAQLREHGEWFLLVLEFCCLVNLSTDFFFFPLGFETQRKKKRRMKYNRCLRPSGCFWYSTELGFSFYGGHALLSMEDKPKEKLQVSVSVHPKREFSPFLRYLSKRTSCEHGHGPQKIEAIPSFLHVRGKMTGPEHEKFEYPSPEWSITAHPA